MRVRNLGGLVFTIPYKARACAPRRRAGRAGAALSAPSTPSPVATMAAGARDIFDGAGCVEAFRRRGLAFAGKRVMLLGAGRRRLGHRDGDRVRAAGVADGSSTSTSSVRVRLAANVAAKSGASPSRPARPRSTTSISCSTPRPSACSTMRGCRSPCVAAARARRVRCDRQAGAHAAHRARRAVWLHHRVRPRDDARPDRADGGLFLRGLNAAYLPVFRPRKSVPTGKSEDLLQHFPARGGKVTERDIHDGSQWIKEAA